MIVCPGKDTRVIGNIRTTKCRQWCSYGLTCSFLSLHSRHRRHQRIQATHLQSHNTQRTVKRYKLSHGTITKKNRTYTGTLQRHHNTHRNNNETYIYLYRHDLQSFLTAHDLPIFDDITDDNKHIDSCQIVENSKHIDHQTLTYTPEHRYVGTSDIGTQTSEHRHRNTDIETSGTHNRTREAYFRLLLLFSGIFSISTTWHTDTIYLYYFIS